MAGPFASIGAARLASHYIETLTVNLRFPDQPPHGSDPAAMAETLVRDLAPAVEQALDIAAAEFGDLVLDDLAVDLPPVAADGVTENDRAALREALLAAIRAAAGGRPDVAMRAMKPVASQPSPASQPQPEAGRETASPAGSFDLPAADALPGPAALQGWTPAWLAADPLRPAQVLAALRQGHASVAALLDGRSAEAVQVLLSALIAADTGRVWQVQAGGDPVIDLGSPLSRPELASRLQRLIGRQRGHSPVQPAPVQPERSDRGSVSEQPDGSGIEALARQLMAGQLAVTALPAGLSAESLCALFEVISQARHGQDGRLLREAVRDTLADDRADAASTLRQALHSLLAGDPVDLEHREPTASAPSGPNARGAVPPPRGLVQASPDNGTPHTEIVPEDAVAIPANPAIAPGDGPGGTLLQHLREGSVGIDELAAGRSIPALADLFRRLAVAAMGAENAGRIADAADAVAATHAAPALFWRHLLAALADNRSLDLEAAAEGQHTDDPQTVATLPVEQDAVGEVTGSEPEAAIAPQALLRRLRDGSLGIDRLVAGYAAVQLADLFRRLAVAAMGAENAGRISDAAEAVAATHAAPALFWRHLLAALADNRPLDLEAAAAPGGEWQGRSPSSDRDVPPDLAPPALARGLAQIHADLEAVLRGVLPPGGLAGAVARMPPAVRFRLRRILAETPGLAALILSGRSQPERQAFAAALGGWTENLHQPAVNGAVQVSLRNVPAARPDAQQPEAAAWLAAALTDADRSPEALTMVALSLTQLAPQAVWRALLDLPMAARFDAAARLADMLTEADLARFALAFPAGTGEGWLAGLEALWAAETDGLPRLQQRALFWRRTLRLLAGGQSGNLMRAFAIAALARRSAAEPMEPQAGDRSDGALARRLQAMASLPLLAGSSTQHQALAAAIAAAEGAERGAGNAVQPAPTATAITSSAAYALYAEMQRGQVPVGALAEAVHRLQSDAPLLLHRFWADIAANPAHLDALMWQRSAPELRALLAAALALTPTPDADAHGFGAARAEAETLLTVPDPGEDPLRRAAHRLARAAGLRLQQASHDTAATAGAVPPSLPEALAAALQDAGSGNAADVKPLLHAMLLHAPAQLATMLRGQPPPTAVAAILALPEQDRARLLAHLAPGLAGDGIAALEWIAAALPMPGVPVRAVAWTALADLALTPPPDRAVQRYGRAVLRRLSTASRLSDGALARQLAAGLAAAPVSDPVVRQLRGLAGAEARRPPSAAAAEAPAAGGWWTDDAGIVLLSVYLPRLYEMRALVIEGEFVDQKARARARALTRYAIWGETISNPDSDPAGRRDCVTAVLCGQEPNHPFEALVLDEEDRTMVDGLLQAVIGNWTAIGNTSVSGLREAFLQRPGVLRREAENWRLRVEGRAYDMLIDRLPWTYGTIRHRWMEQPLIVDWRP